MFRTVSGMDIARFGGLAVAWLLCVTPARLEAAPPNVGYRDFVYGTAVNSTPTGEKPESKLWWNDGSWWGSLWDPGALRYSIHRLDAATQTWVNTGTALDPRGSTLADVLWDGNRLYVVSHVFSTSAEPTSAANAGRLYRYAYDAGARTYSLDPGFPVDVNSSISETLVLDKDSNGKLWVTWVEGGKVKVNRTLDDDLTWGQPFNLPVQGANVQADDISCLGAMGDGRIGLMWSNQASRAFYFAVHLDQNADTQWEPREVALTDPVLGQVTDDHINLKLSCDPSGAAYAVIKTGLTGSSQPLVYVLRRQAGGAWSRHVFGTFAENHTRPILSIDADAESVHVVAQSNKSGRQVIYVKSASLADLQFPSGLGRPLIDSPDDPEVNNPTTAKHCAGAASGLLVLASDRGTLSYLHNLMPLGEGTTPIISAFQPASGIGGTEVTISGGRLTGATEVTFNEVAASSFVVDSDSRIRATAPQGATTGRIRVVAPGGSATSASNFVVVTTPAITTFDPRSGAAGTQVTLTGTGFTGASQVTFGGVPSASFAVDGDAQLRATVPAGAVTGRIGVSNAAGAAETVADFTVTSEASTLVLHTAHDAQVKSTSPTTNYGQLPTLRIRSLEPEYRFYTQFVVDEIGGPIGKATLRFFVTDESDHGGAVHVVANTYDDTSTPWTEDGLTWDNGPAIEVGAIDSLGAVIANTWVELDVTPAITGNGTYSFACRSGSTNSAIFSSDEGANRPELVLLVNQAPAPTDVPAGALHEDAAAAMLRHGRPNPFRAWTDLSFDLPSTTRVRLTIHDVRGRVVRRLVDARLPSGPHGVRWDGRDDQELAVPIGIYFVRLETPAGVEAGKIILIR